MGTPASNEPGEAPVSLKNKLLRLIPETERKRILSISEQIEMRPRQVLHHWRLPMESVYFIERGLVSISAKVDDARFVEVWLTGSEGMIGAPLILDEEDQQLPHRRVVQVGGVARRIPAREFTAVLPELPVLRKTILRYINVVLLQTSQSGTCNSVHSIRQRLARCLLVACNGLESADLPLTHEVLAQLLGVRRASVTECLDAFEREGSIRIARRAINIRDEAALRGVCCDCFDLIDREYRRQMSRVPVLKGPG